MVVGDIDDKVAGRVFLESRPLKEEQLGVVQRSEQRTAESVYSWVLDLNGLPSELEGPITHGNPLLGVDSLHRVLR